MRTACSGSFVGYEFFAAPTTNPLDVNVTTHFISLYFSVISVKSRKMA
jgi:hypothetical protein